MPASVHVQLVPSLAGVAEGTVVTIEGDEAHHAVAVRRLRVAEPIVLTDGAGRSALCLVRATAKRRLDVEVTRLTETDAPSPSFTVVQAIPKGDRGELAVEVLTEIGVSTIVPWAASRSVAVWKGERAERSLAKWRATAREAAKQSRRSWFPEVTPMASTADVAARASAAAVAVVLHEQAGTPLAAVDLPAEGEIVVVVGPEGGLSDEEVTAFESSGAVTVRLGAEVLRTSTAGLAAVAALLARTSRWT
jgi:16S rRNA (uracil1498-N3)-methyltransferase